jgi:hypothetical protein
MRTIGAIFTLTLRSLMRSRFLLSLVLLSLAVVLLLPLLVQDDGTPAGRAQVLLRYTLGVVMFLLSVGTLGVGPGLVAGELESRRLQQVLVKPVRFWQIWAGKWLALAAVNAVVLGGSVLLADGLLRFSLRESRLTAEQAAELTRKVRVSRIVLPPRETAPDAAEVKAKLAALVARGMISPQTPEAEARRTAVQRIRFERNIVPPGGARRWVFQGGPDGAIKGPLTLQVEFLTSGSAGPGELEGEWTAGISGQAPFFRTRSRLRPMVPQEIVIPAFPPTREPLEATFRHEGSANAPAIVFHVERGVRLLAPSGSYGMNLFRAYLLMVLKLVLLAAVGVTMGSLFSPPVAVLTSYFALAVIGFSGYVGWVAETGVFYVAHQHGGEAHADEHDEPALVLRLLEPPLKASYRVLHRILGPLQALDPLERVAGGERVPPADVARGFAAMGVLGSGLLALLAAGVFGRRETG